MIRAYKETYLYNAASKFGSMMDFSVNSCDLDGDTYLQMFIASGLAHQFERGSPKVIAGMSGIELAIEAITATTGVSPSIDPDYTGLDSRTEEYWAGWALARYQWYTSLSFSLILQSLPFSVITDMYPTLHEADITKFYSVADEITSCNHPQTNLKRIRDITGISQSKLAEEANVSLRSIQMYEQRNKDINKAQTISVVKIARALGCDVEDLMDPGREESIPRCLDHQRYFSK